MFTFTNILLRVAVCTRAFDEPLKLIMNDLSLQCDLFSEIFLRKRAHEKRIYV